MLLYRVIRLLLLKNYKTKDENEEYQNGVDIIYNAQAVE